MRALCALALALLAATGRAHGRQEELRAGDVVMRYWPGQERLAASLVPRDAAFTFPGLPPDILHRGIEVTLFIAPDEARFDSLTGGRIPEWGAGVAIPRENIIIVPGYVSPRTGTHALPQIIRHELAHVALHRHLGGVRIPRWFTEGYATWTAGQFDADAGWQLRLALATGRAPPLDSLTLDWPLLATDARLAYLLSASAVAYLYSLGSPETFARFLETWRETESLEDAMRRDYILATPQFERLWRQHVRRRYGWIQILAQTAFIWVVAGLFVIALFVIRRRRDRRRLAALRESELPDAPAFWLDPPPEAGGEAEGGDEPGPPRA